MSEDPAPAPIVVNATALPEQIASAVRLAGVLIGGMVALLGFLEARDLRGLIAWLRSDEFIPFAGAVLAAGSFLWSQLKVRRTNRALRRIVSLPQVPDAIGYVKGTPSPAPDDRPGA